MARPRGKSVSQHKQLQQQQQQLQQHPQQLPVVVDTSNELPNVNAQLDFINKLVKWNIQDLDHFINVLTARISAEESYVQSLERIEKIAPVPEPEVRYFGDARTSYQKVAIQYEVSMSRMVIGRREVLKTMKLQLQRLYNVKETQESRRKKIKTILGEKNSNYLTYRSRDFSKRQRAYTTKCEEIDAVEEEAQQHAAAAASGTGAGTVPPSTVAASGGGGVLEEQGPRKSSDSDQSGSSASHEHSSHRRRMAGLKALRNQIVNAMSSAVDPNTRAAKLKRDMIDLDRDYRKSIMFMERLRRKQVETSQHAMKHVEVMFFDKSEMTKSVLHNILTVEQDMQEKESALTRTVFQTTEQVDGRADVGLFCTEFDKLKGQFNVPEQIHYDNYYHGILKDVQFGTSLESYARIHHRAVPLLVEKCIKAVEDQGGLKKEGIYRVSGRQSNLEALKVDFEKDEVNVNLGSYDVFTIASVLKVYLRELEFPLFALPMKYRAEYSNKDDPTRLRELESNLIELSDPHRNTLKAVIEHLAQVTSYAEANKMNVQNLALIFTPAIFHDHNNAENPGEWCNDKVFSDLITHHHTLFVTVESVIAERQQQQQPQQRKGSVNTGRPPLPTNNSNNSHQLQHQNPQQQFASAATLQSTAATMNDQQLLQQPVTGSSTITLPSPSPHLGNSNSYNNEPPLPSLPPPSRIPLERSDSRGKKLLARKDSLNALQRSPSLIQQQQQQQQQKHQHQKKPSTSSSSQKELPPTVAQPLTPEPSSPAPVVK
ncbi:hypothetical protein BDB00DRAFT_866603 [Zychaea mexicana]|uniref:uncharacterized protein n=1 Tax=Zychaea mexicana TaxID=64656 RepID=UPI0022FE16BC|nr:uncharacterized protein BDB00DRAFT_866603 [Zychaea mexicana]KAI9499109.1 hypothetical protein BDB00DRAFT_866603 [Zychaea mexicana]